MQSSGRLVLSVALVGEVGKVIEIQLAVDDDFSLLRDLSVQRSKAVGCARGLELTEGTVYAKTLFEHPL